MTLDRSRAPASFARVGAGSVHSLSFDPVRGRDVVVLRRTGLKRPPASGAFLGADGLLNVDHAGSRAPDPAHPHPRRAASAPPLAVDEPVPGDLPGAQGLSGPPRPSALPASRPEGELDRPIRRQTPGYTSEADLRSLLLLDLASCLHTFLPFMVPDTAAARCLRRAVLLLDEGGGKDLGVRDGAVWQKQSRDAYWGNATVDDYMARPLRRFNQLYDSAVGARAREGSPPASRERFVSFQDPTLPRYCVDERGKLKKSKKVSFETWEHREWIHRELEGERPGRSAVDGRAVGGLRAPTRGCLKHARPSSVGRSSGIHDAVSDEAPASGVRVRRRGGDLRRSYAFLGLPSEGPVGGASADRRGGRSDSESSRGSRHGKCLRRTYAFSGLPPLGHSGGGAQDRLRERSGAAASPPPAGGSPSLPQFGRTIYSARGSPELESNPAMDRSSVLGVQGISDGTDGRDGRFVDQGVDREGGVTRAPEGKGKARAVDADDPPEASFGLGLVAESELREYHERLAMGGGGIQINEPEMGSGGPDVALECAGDLEDVGVRGARSEVSRYSESRVGEWAGTRMGEASGGVDEEGGGVDGARVVRVMSADAEAEVGSGNSELEQESPELGEARRTLREAEDERDVMGCVYMTPCERWLEEQEALEMSKAADDRKEDGDERSWIRPEAARAGPARVDGDDDLSIGARLKLVSPHARFSFLSFFSLIYFLVLRFLLVLPLSFVFPTVLFGRSLTALAFPKTRHRRGSVRRCAFFPGKERGWTTSSTLFRYGNAPRRRASTTTSKTVSRTSYRRWRTPRRPTTAPSTPMTTGAAAIARKSSLARRESTVVYA